MARTQIRLNTQAKQHSLTTNEVKPLSLEVVSGLDIKMNGGHVVIGTVIQGNPAVDATLTLPDDTTVTIYYNAGTGVLLVNPADPFAQNLIIVGQATTASGVVTSLVDFRALFSFADLYETLSKLRSEAVTGDIDGVNVTFLLGSICRYSEFLAVYVNGLRQQLEVDYTVDVDVNGYINQVIFTTAPLAGDIIFVDHV
jgi:hypothetical protein